MASTSARQHWLYHDSSTHTHTHKESAQPTTTKYACIKIFLKMDTLIAVEPLRVEHRPFSHENRQHHVGITITHLTLSCHPHQEYLYKYIYPLGNSANCYRLP